MTPTISVSDGREYNLMLPYGVLKTDDQTYALLQELREVRSGFSGGIEFVSHPELVNMCHACGRGDLVEGICTSVEQMIEKGWIVPLEEVRKFQQGR